MRFDSRLHSRLAYGRSPWGTPASPPKGLGPPADKSQQECVYANHRDIPQASETSTPLASRRKLFLRRSGSQARTLSVLDGPRSVGAGDHRRGSRISELG